MPIYAYKCESCGHAKDVLQKMSDATLTDCPQCGAATFKKQLTSAGFQLKGSGWYVTDFRGGAQAGAPTAESGTAVGAEKSDPSEGSKPASTNAPAATPSTGAPAATAAKPASTAPAPAASPGPASKSSAA